MSKLNTKRTITILTVFFVLAFFIPPHRPINAAKHTAPELNFQLVAESGTAWRIPANAIRLSVLVVGGGGGGAPGLGRSGSGGGAGGLVYLDDYLKTCRAKPGDTIEIKVGLPGKPVDTRMGRYGFSGQDSIFGKIVALGGGGGGRGNEEGHRASQGGSSGGGPADAPGNPAPALQPRKSGFGYGFGHPGNREIGGGGGGAGGPGTPQGKGGGGIGLQGIPLNRFIDRRTGQVTSDFDAENRSHYRVLFDKVFGSHIGDEGWFAGGGAHNSRAKTDKGGRGGGSTWDAMPHTGGGGGGSTHGFEAGTPGVGGSGVVLVRCRHRDGSLSVLGWGRLQPGDIILRKPYHLRDQGEYEAALRALDELENVESLPARDRVAILRAYGQIYAVQGLEDEALDKFRKATQLEAEIKNNRQKNSRRQ